MAAAVDPHLGQIGLIAGPVSKLEWAIAFGTQSPVFHVIVGVGHGMVMSAQPKGARLDPESRYPYAIWSKFPLSPEQAANTALWARARVGAKYNWADDVVITLHNLTPIRVARRVLSRLDNGTRYTCSQFADAALRFGGGYQVFNDGRHPGRVAPASFVPIFQEYGWWPSHLWNPAHHFPAETAS